MIGAGLCTNEFRFAAMPMISPPFFPQQLCIQSARSSTIPPPAGLHNESIGLVGACDLWLAGCLHFCFQAVLWFFF